MPKATPVAKEWSTRPAMAVNNAFGIARCCRGVADQAGFVFIAVHREIIDLRKIFNQIVIQNNRGECGRWHYPGLGHDDIFLDCLELIFKRFNQEINIFVNEKNAVFGVINDVYQIFGGQPYIEGVQNSTHAGNAKVKFHMAMIVQRKRGDPVTLFDTKRAQGSRQLTCAFVPASISITESAGRVNRDDFLGRIILGRMLHKIGQQQRIIHHSF
jgi:hypothetical protein